MSQLTYKIQLRNEQSEKNSFTKIKLNKKCVENIKISFENDTKKSLEKINVNDKFICEFKTFETIFEFTPFLGKNWLQGKK